MNSYLKSFGRAAAFLSLLGTLLVFTGCGSLHSPPPEASNDVIQTSESSDILRPGDIVFISYSGVSEPPPRHEDRIREDGFITLPFIKQVEAAGKTRAQLQQEITRLYVPSYYKQLTVTVNSDTRYFYVGGEIKRPGNYVYPGSMSVLKAISAAGDFTDFANKKNVWVTRSKGKRPIKVNCIEAQKHPDLDLPIYPEDRIFIPRRRF